MQAVLFLGVAVAAVFVWFTGGPLPEVVASHFGATGVANGFMPRGEYMGLMLTLVITVPLLFGLSAKLATVLPVGLVNLPNREFWLATGRRPQTLQSLVRLCVPYALGVAVFLCFVHWLVVQANASEPVQLSSPALLAGLAVFGIGTLAWVLALRRRFSRVT